MLLTVALVATAVLLVVLVLLSLLERIEGSLRETGRARDLSAARAHLAGTLSLTESPPGGNSLLEETLAQDVFTERPARRARH
jgi:hypothetical protein